MVVDSVENLCHLLDLMYLVSISYRHVVQFYSDLFSSNWIRGQENNREPHFRRRGRTT